jgi:hypothetical protein
VVSYCIQFFPYIIQRSNKKEPRSQCQFKSSATCLNVLRVFLSKLDKHKFGANQSLVYNATHMHTHWVIEIITAEHNTILTRKALMQSIKGRRQKNLIQICT